MPLACVLPSEKIVSPSSPLSINVSGVDALAFHSLVIVTIELLEAARLESANKSDGDSIFCVCHRITRGGLVSKKPHVCSLGEHLEPMLEAVSPDVEDTPEI